MILKLFLEPLSKKMKSDFFRNRGLFIGARIRQGRKIYLYMVDNLFAEIIFDGDDETRSPEVVHLLPGLQVLNNHLGKEIHQIAQ